MKINVRYTILVLFSAVLFSCENEEIPSNTLFVKEISDPTFYKDLFEYENGYLVKFNRLFGERIETTTQFQYSGHQLSRVEIKRDQGLEQIIELSYGENGLRKEEKATTKQNGDITEIRVGLFSYEDGMIKSIKYSYEGVDHKATETVFEWINGNITQMDFYLIDGEYTYLTSSRTMTYDDKRNFSNQDIGFIYRVMSGEETIVSKNNVIEEFEDVGDLIINRGRYNFTYNNEGYPIGYIQTVGSQEYNPVQINYK
ncbi:hypothetical protein [Cyclobacterium roseum]|uniref:hypothetical protein n=1 Tax=Cyclobacterium roseum TaxID=2666137 RepID=UPI0013913851|nr:hypothetical protein [Cyclobacterium roseum]